MEGKITKTRNCMGEETAILFTWENEEDQIYKICKEIHEKGKSGEFSGFDCELEEMIEKIANAKFSEKYHHYSCFQNVNPDVPMMILDGIKLMYINLLQKKVKECMSELIELQGKTLEGISELIEQEEGLGNSITE